MFTRSKLKEVNHMKVGIAQISLEQGKPKENYNKVDKIVENVMQQQVKPEVIVLPEL